MTKPTRTEIRRGSIGNRKGWCFEVSYLESGFPNFISALYKTKREVVAQLHRYLTTGDFDFYGTAE